MDKLNSMIRLSLKFEPVYHIHKYSVRIVSILIPVDYPFNKTILTCLFYTFKAVFGYCFIITYRIASVKTSPAEIVFLVLNSGRF